MLLELHELVAKYDMNIDGVLHVGAHLAEEADEYAALGIDRVTWIEACPDLIPRLEARLAHFDGQWVVHALIGEHDGEILPFNVTNYDSMSSSVLEFGTHPQFSPDTVFEKRYELEAQRLDTVARNWGVQANFVNLDLQGYEGPALRGAPEVLAAARYVYSEVNKAEVYVGCTKIDELDEILADFDRVETSWVADQGWGDALWVRR